MGDLIEAQILIIFFIALAFFFIRDKEIRKLLLKIDGVITAIFIILDLLFLMIGLKNWL